MRMMISSIDRKSGEAMLLRMASHGHCRKLSITLAVYDRGSETRRKKEPRLRQVVDLPRIGVAEPLPNSVLLLRRSLNVYLS